MRMKKLVTDAPADNGEMMLNLIFVKDKEVWVHYGSEAGEDCTLVEFCRRLCAACGTCSYEEVPYQTGDDLDDIGDILMDCSSDGCPVGTMYFAMIQAAELRERLRMYEDRGVMPDELERLLLCRHNCKIDCLLKKYNELKERYDNEHRSVEG